MTDETAHGEHAIPAAGRRPVRGLTYHGDDGTELFAAALGTGPVVVLLHGGGPDHHSLVPLARRLAARHRVVLPDVRGYGRSRCPDPARHTWTRYAADVIALLDHQHTDHAVLGGTGLGSSITLRACQEHPDRVRGAILISVEDIEDDQAKVAETAFLDAFAHRARTHGLQAAWAPVLPTLTPLITTLVADAIARSDPDSVAAAAAIGHDRLVRSPADLAAITTPTLVIPGADHRHPAAVADAVVRALPHAHLAPVAMTADLRTAEDLADAVAPAITAFLDRLPGNRRTSRA